MSTQFIFAKKTEMTCPVNHFLNSGNDVISLESRPLNFHVFIHKYSLPPQTYFRWSLTCVLDQYIHKQIKSVNVDKVGSKKLLVSNSCLA